MSGNPFARLQPAAPHSAPASPAPAGKATSQEFLDSILAGLNPQQHQAVVHTGTPLLIMAGAGSGKTSVLTRKIAFLLATQKVSSGQVLAITFTNKAANEMKTRVMDLLGPVANYMWIGTFHSICVRILRQQHTLLPGLNSSFTIYDTDDQRRLIGLILQELEYQLKEKNPRQIAAIISGFKNEMKSPAEVADAFDVRFEENRAIAAKVYEIYQERLREANAVDFDDIIGLTVQLFKDYPEVARHYRRQFRQILIDEYQDTNPAQYQMVRELVGLHDENSPVPPSELTVVGDSDQSIYSFRGATIRNIEEFGQDFPNATTILLEQNYRSTQNILSAANAVIAQNTGRIEKNLWTESGPGEQITGYVADTAEDEANYITRQIIKLTDDGDYHCGQIAIMYRMNSASRVLEEALMRSGIPYRVVGGTKFYDRAEIRDVIAYLHLIANPADEMALRRIINTPRRGIGDKAVGSVENYARTKGITMWDAIYELTTPEATVVAARTKKALLGFYELISGCRELINPVGEVSLFSEEHDVVALVKHVLTATGMLAGYEDSRDPQDLARADNLKEFVDLARIYVSENEGVELPEEMQELAEGLPEPGSLAGFLQQISLVADADQLPDDDETGGMVTLMTLHTAKGLEYPVVFLPGWEENVLPHQRSIGEAAGLQEERRLAYVGITRAQEKLYITRAFTRHSFGNGPEQNAASRFLGAIPGALLDWERDEEAARDAQTSWGASFGRSYAGGDYGYRGVYNSRSTSVSSGSTIPRAKKKGAALHLQPGDLVNHQKYGVGTVVGVNQTAGMQMVDIDFGSQTMKIVPTAGVLEKL